MILRDDAIRFKCLSAKEESCSLVNLSIAFSAIKYSGSY